MSRSAQSLSFSFALEAEMWPPIEAEKVLEKMAVVKPLGLGAAPREPELRHWRAVACRL